MSMYGFLKKYHTPQQTRFTTVIVAPSGGDYTSIKAAIAGVAPTAAKPIRVYVRNGTYNEIQIAPKNYLTIEGQSRDGVIIVADGLRTDVDPVSGQRYVDMNFTAKHGFWTGPYIVAFRNLTIRVNDVKYCIHHDEGDIGQLVMNNVRLQHSNGTPLGAGSRETQFIVANSCIFEKLGANVAGRMTGSHGIYWHNWNNRSGPTYMTLTNCTFINCGVVSFRELGSDQTDLVLVTNCSTDDPVKSFAFFCDDMYWNGGGQGVLNVPYNINLHTMSGTFFPAAIDYDIADRPNLLDYVVME